MTDAPPPPEKPGEPVPQVRPEPTPGFSASTPSQAPPSAVVVPTAAGRPQSRQFAFDGGAGTYVGTFLLAVLITVFTLGICYPFAFVLRERWRAKHSFIEGRQLVFVGKAWGLFGHLLKWFLLMIITLGIYSLWVGPRLYRWKWENTSWAVQVPRELIGPPQQ